jgi:hypothetical protein
MNEETNETKPDAEENEPIENPEGFGPTAAIMSKEIPIVTCVP